MTLLCIQVKITYIEFFGGNTMGKYIKRKQLTEEQYQMANNAMSIILAICYIAYIATEITNANSGTGAPFWQVRCGLYGFIAVANIVLNKLKGKTKKAMLFYAITFLIAYLLLVMNNGVITMVLAFPALIGFMLYLNSIVVGAGCLCVFIICALKCGMVRAAGNEVLFDYGNLITIGFVICIFGSYIAIAILYKFSEMDSEVIAKEAAHRAEVAEKVSTIVEKVANDFVEVITGLDGVKESMSSVDFSMTGITESSESTATAVNRQADKTSDIQYRLENTNNSAMNARNTTDNLKNVISNGMILADDLQKQSDLVDQNVAMISQTVEQLVSNVQKVSGITDSILNISSQTNLLALNASIEAARAGEAGRGFAVVADEIRKLAEETKVSTEKITEIINELKAVTEETQQGIEESVSAIEIQRQKVTEVTNSFTEVGTGMDVLEVEVDTMSQEVEAVLIANGEIVDSISTLSASSEEVSAETQNCKDTINGAYRDIGTFSDMVEGTFVQLQELAEATQE